MRSYFFPSQSRKKEIQSGFPSAAQYLSVIGIQWRW